MYNTSCCSTPNRWEHSGNPFSVMRRAWSLIIPHGLRCLISTVIYWQFCYLFWTDQCVSILKNLMFPMSRLRECKFLRPYGKNHKDKLANSQKAQIFGFSLRHSTVLIKKTIWDTYFYFVLPNEFVLNKQILYETF